jgi:hypothetical protein
MMRYVPFLVLVLIALILSGVPRSELALDGDAL